MQDDDHNDSSSQRTKAQNANRDDIVKAFRHDREAEQNAVAKGGKQKPWIKERVRKSKKKQPD
jgi:hypothetical protein